MENLPLELIYGLTDELTIKDIVCLSSVSWKFRERVDSQTVWRKKFKERWPQSNVEKSRCWKNTIMNYGRVRDLYMGMIRYLPKIRARKALCAKKSIYVLSQDGKLYSWYKNDVELLFSTNVEDIMLTDEKLFILTSKGEIYYITRYGVQLPFQKIPFPTFISKIAVGTDHLLALSNKGELFGVGSNLFRQLGVSEGDNFNSCITLADNVRSIFASNHSSGYITKDNVLYLAGMDICDNVDLNDRLDQWYVAGRDIKEAGFIKYTLYTLSMNGQFKNNGTYRAKSFCSSPYTTRWKSSHVVKEKDSIMVTNESLIIVNEYGEISYGLDLQHMLPPLMHIDTTTERCVTVCR